MCLLNLNFFSLPWFSIEFHAISVWPGPGCANWLVFSSASCPSSTWCNGQWVRCDLSIRWRMKKHFNRLDNRNFKKEKKTSWWIIRQEEEIEGGISFFWLLLLLLFRKIISFLARGSLGSPVAPRSFFVWVSRVYFRNGRRNVSRSCAVGEKKVFSDDDDDQERKKRKKTVGNKPVLARFSADCWWYKYM